MTALFTLPGQTPFSAGVYLAGATLTFSQTGTSTPQNTYQEEALVTPHANPVVADANGVFPAIYLDPSLPSYRAVLKTSGGVTVNTWDGVPSNANQSTFSRVVSTNPYIILYDTDGTANQRRYRLRVAGNVFTIGMLNDAENSETVIFSSTAGASATNGTNTLAASITGSFTGTLTGMSGTTTLTINYVKSGNLVRLYAAAGTTGTSNATTMSMTGLPAAVTPTVTQNVACTKITDNGNDLCGFASIVGSGNSITFGLLRTGTVANRVDSNSSIFTNSGSKGLGDGWSIAYSV